MSQVLIRRALEKRLEAMTPAMATAYENAAYTPVIDTPYQRVNLLPGAPDNSIQSASVYFAIGVFQITLCYPIGSGPGIAQARCELICLQFRRGTTLTQAPLQVIVTSTPRIAPALIDGDRYCIPISISYQSKVEI